MDILRDMLSSSRSLLKCHLITMTSLTTLSHSSTHKCTSTHARAHVHTISSLLAPPDILYICLFAYDSSFPTKVWVPWDQGLWFVLCYIPSTCHSFWHKLGTQHIWYCERCNKPTVNQGGWPTRSLISLSLKHYVIFVDYGSVKDVL